jgi:hypothetical protein
MKNTKLELNKITGYYEGPSGAFYDFKHDEIFVLEWNGSEVYRMSIHKTVGKFYDYHVKGATSRKTVMLGFDHVIYLGEVGSPFRNL